MSQTFSYTLRRKRLTAAWREALADVSIRPQNLIQPYFIYQELSQPEDLKAIFGQQKHTINSLIKEVDKGLNQGVCSPLLFIIPSEKKEKNFNYDFDCQVIQQVKEKFKDDINLMTDLCLCSQTHTGHCGFINQDNTIDNEESVRELVNKAYVYAQAGSDCIAPSDMMDSRILGIRQKLNRENLSHKLIMSYSTKFSSNFYGPFRDAAQSTPSLGDRKSYQIDYCNRKDAIHSSLRDMQEGADILMVKPAGAYLDIIRDISCHQQLRHLPLAAYQVSGEYQGLKVMADHHLLDFEKTYYETLIAIKRAGAQLIITYGANQFKKTFQGLT